MRSRLYLPAAAVVMVALFVVVTGGLAGGAASADADAGTPMSRVFIAGVAADAAASPTTSPGGSALVTAGHLASSSINGLGQPTVLTVYGDVHNGLDHPIGSVTVSVTAVWSGQTDTRTATIPMATVAPGAVAPFTVLMGGDDASNASLSVTVAGYTDLTSAEAGPSLPVNLGAPEAPAIGPPDPKTGIVPLSDNLFAISGTVGNTTSSPLRVDRVVAAVYTADGLVALVGSTGGITAAHPGPDPAVLAPGEAGSFVIYLPRRTLLSIAGATQIYGFASASPAP